MLNKIVFLLNDHSVKSFVQSNRIGSIKSFVLWKKLKFFLIFQKIHSSNTEGARSLAINSLAFYSLAISFIYYQPHLLSPHLLSMHLLSVSLDLGLTCSRAHLPSSLTCYQVNLLSGLTCYQNVCSLVSTAINAHLLSKTSY